jgi:hypothetical protein
MHRAANSFFLKEEAGRLVMSSPIMILETSDRQRTCSWRWLPFGNMGEYGCVDEE